MTENASTPPLLLRFYREYAATGNTALFAGKVMARYTRSTLTRVAVSRVREVRRAAVLAIGLLEDYSANPILGRALYDQDRVVRTLAQEGLEAIWQRQGTQHQREQLQRLIRLNRAGEYDLGAATAGKLVRLAPWIAEYWHQRAIARFEQRRIHGSLEDYRQTLTLNQFHFPAALGMAQCYAHLENAARTVESLHAALRINPRLEEVRARINAILRYP